MIRVGVAGWDYPDWGGIVYPCPAPKGFDPLAYLAAFFDTIEINTTFYHQPDPVAARSWVRRVAFSPTFRFTAKLYRELTHPRWPADSSAPRTGADLGEETKRFRSGIAPLSDAGRLGAVLAQFPHSFHDREESREHLRALHDLLRDLPLVAEFRHRSWDHDGALRFLHGLGVGFCNIDQPSIGSTLRPTGHVTSRIAYIRLHGRNAQSWFAPRATTAERYDYLYSMQELRPWVERAERLEQRAEEVFIIANNHYRGKAPANALMLKAELSRRKVDAPEDLVAAHPELERITTSRRRSPAQGHLFDRD